MDKDTKEKDYTEQDLEDSLRRTFVDKGFKKVLIDGYVAQKDWNVLNYGIDQGWLRKKRDIEESQYTAMIYVLTDKGKKHFGLDN